MWIRQIKSNTVPGGRSWKPRAEEELETSLSASAMSSVSDSLETEEQRRSNKGRPILNLLRERGKPRLLPIGRIQPVRFNPATNLTEPPLIWREDIDSRLRKRRVLSFFRMRTWRQCWVGGVSGIFGSLDRNHLWPIYYGKNPSIFADMLPKLLF